MKLLKIPFMDKDEYDQLINENYVSRMAFNGEYPYIAPLLYVFNGSYLYFLSTKYGKKQNLFQKDPQVAVEIENYAPDMSQYQFVTLRGRIKRVVDDDEKLIVRKMFARMIKEKDLSNNIMAALGHSPKDPPESLLEEERSYVWKLVDVKEIIALKNK